MKQRRARMVYYGLLCRFAFHGSAAVAESSSWSQVAEEIAAQISLAESLYQEDKPTKARHAVTQAYFGVFADRKNGGRDAHRARC